MAELKREKEGISCEVFSEYKIFWEVDSVNTSIHTATHDRNLRISLVTSLSLFPHIPVTKSYQYYLQIVSNASTFLHHQSHWPSVTRATRVTSWLVSNSVLAPSSPFSKSSQSGPILCLSCSEPFRGFHTWLVSPCLRFQPHLKQVHNLLATWPFSSSEKTKPFSTLEPLYLLISLPGMLFTCNSVDRLLSSFRSRSNFHFLWEFFPDSYFKLCPWLYFLILTEISFQVYIPICNYIFVDDKRNHESFVHHSIPRV